MSQKRSVLLLCSSLLATACLCTPGLLIPLAASPTSPAIPTAIPPTLCSGSACAVDCTQILEGIINASEGSGSSIKTFSGNSAVGYDYYELARYRVLGDDLVGATFPYSSEEWKQHAQDLEAHQVIWELFTTIIPLESRRMVTEYIIFTDGTKELLAAVEPNASEEDTWSLEVDIVDAEHREALTATLLHEHAHLLTLGQDQAETEQTCPAEYANPGCGQSDSYIEAYYQRFWVALFEEWALINAIHDDGERELQLEGFYQDHQTEFLTAYSTTDVAEDIAEAWMYFILVQKPDAISIADEKILFFYDYPELVQLREKIMPRVCEYFQDIP